MNCALPEVDGKAYQVLCSSFCHGTVMDIFLHQIPLSFARLPGSRSHGKVLISGLVKTGSLREAVALVDEVRSFSFVGGVGKSRSTVLSVMLCQMSLLQYCVEIFFCPEMLEAAHKIS